MTNSTEEMCKLENIARQCVSELLVKFNKSSLMQFQSAFSTLLERLKTASDELLNLAELAQEPRGRRSTRTRTLIKSMSTAGTQNECHGTVMQWLGSLLKIIAHVQKTFNSSVIAYVDR